MQRIWVLSAMVIISSVTLFYMRYWETLPVVKTHHSERALKGLKSDVENLEALTIYSGELTLLRANVVEGMWIANHLSENYKFPLNQAKIRQFIERLSTADIIAEKTSNPDYFHFLKVTDTLSEGSESHTVILESETRVWRLIIGKQSDHKSGTFVRVPGKTTALLMNRKLDIPKNNESWLQRPVLSFAQGAVQSITIQKPQQRNVFDVTLTENDPADGIFAELFQLDFDGVLPRNSVILSWFTQTPAQQVDVTTNTDEWTLSFYQNAESQHVWMTVDNPKNPWQSTWAYNLKPEAREALLKAFVTENASL